MWKIASSHSPKLIEASNAMDTTYQAFSKDLKRFGFVKKSRMQKKTFSYRLGLTESLNKLQIKKIQSKEIIHHANTFLNRAKKRD